MDKKETKKIRKGDKVMAIAGNDRGQVGQVIRVVGDRAVVQGLNICKKHVKRSQTNPKGNIIDFEKPIHISNLRICNEENKPVKLRVRFNDQGQRELYYKIDSEAVLYRAVKATK